MAGNTKVIVLAGGKGTRLQSDAAHLPKVMRLVAGKPLLYYVLNNVSFIDQRDTIVVVGYMGDLVREAFPGEYQYVTQEQQLGTGHAVSMARPLLEGFDGNVLVCFGDMPLFKPDTFKSLIATHENSGAAVTLLTTMTKVPPAYGRIIRDEKQEIVDIVEQKDCTPDQAKIREVTPGVYVFKCEWLLKALSQLKNDNAQHEYYLTDTPKIIMNMGGKIGSSMSFDEDEIIGVNTMEDLAHAEGVLQERMV